jgi:hypothetical protein
MQKFLDNFKNLVKKGFYLKTKVFFKITFGT